MRAAASRIFRAAAAVAAFVIVVRGTKAGAAPGLDTFTDKAFGVTVRFPADITPTDTFTPNYFDRGAWRVSYAADVGPGTKIVAFALPALHAMDAGGDSEARAELRIGASRDPDVVASCLGYGMNSGDNVETATRTIGGITFTEVPDNGDGGMQQRISTDDFRAVHEGVCYAIDFVQYVGGTSNKKPGYAPAQIERLRGILSAIAFQ